MWIASKYGFFSIVMKGPDEFHVRARFRGDLEELMEACGVDETLHKSYNSDYRYRLVVGRPVVTKIGARIFEEIDYDNFKNKIAETSSQQDKLSAYGDIWSIMYMLQGRDDPDPETED